MEDQLNTPETPNQSSEVNSASENTAPVNPTPAANTYNYNNPSANNAPAPTLESEIAEQKKYFKWFSRIPLIFAIITGALFVLAAFSGSVSMCIALEDEGIIYSALMFFGYIIVGAIVSVAEYFILKILFSQQVLTVLYLEKLNKKDEK